MGHHDPVTDWTTEFDHTDDAWAADPYTIWGDLRERCPVAHTERYGGAWLPTSYADVAAVAYDTARFTSRSVIMSEFRPPMALAPEGNGRMETLALQRSVDPPNASGRNFDIVEGTEQIQQLVIARAISGLRIE